MEKNGFIHRSGGVYYYYQLYIYLLIKKMKCASAGEKQKNQDAMLHTLSRTLLQKGLAESRGDACAIDDGKRNDLHAFAEARCNILSALFALA